MEALVDMAMQSGGTPMALRGIAERQDIPKNYLEQIFMQLRAAGLVRSVRGAAGGFVLAKPPAEIKVADIAAVFEGPIDLIGCSTDPRICRRSMSCAVRRIWVEVGECMKKALDSVTLQELATLQASSEASARPTDDREGE